MAYTNVYPTRINWENEPSINTPINDVNLNKIDYAVYEHDRTLANWDTTKANQSDLLLSVKTIDYDSDTGVFIFTWQNGTTKTVDLNIEKIPVSFSMSPQGVITMTTDDGTTYTADVGALIKTYTFNDSSVIDFTVVTDASGNKTVTADIVDGSITGNKLQPNYLADCQAAQTGAETAQGLSEDSAEDSEAWAKGTRNGVDVPSTDPTYENNAKYWAQHTSASLVGLNDVRVTNPQDKQALTYDAESGKWINGQAAGGTDTIKWSEAATSVKKNLLPNNAISQTINGVTFTVNADGSVDIDTNGSVSTAIAQFQIYGALKLPAGDYILSSGNAVPTNIYWSLQTSSGWQDITDNATEKEFSLASGQSIYKARIYVASGQIVEHLVIKPMIRLASIADGTYVPYLFDNTELVSYKDNAILGAKNLLPNKAVSQTQSGVTYTVNADGSIKAVGTLTTQDPFLISNGWNDYDVSWIKPYEGKSVILSGGIANVSIGVRFYDANGTQIGDLSTATSAGAGTIPSNIVKYDAFLYPFSSGVSVDNTFYPMIRLATDTDDTYVPYAKTNRELTDELNVRTDNITATVQMTEWTLHKVKKYGKIVEAIATMKLGENVSAWSTIAQIPEGFRPSSGQYPQAVGIKNDYTSFVNLQITPNGEVQTAAALTSGTIIRFDATYILD